MSDINVTDLPLQCHCCAEDVICFHNRRVYLTQIPNPEQLLCSLFLPWKATKAFEGSEAFPTSAKREARKDQNRFGLMVHSDWNLIYIQRDKSSLIDEFRFPQGLVNWVFHVAVAAPGPLVVEGRTWKQTHGKQQMQTLVPALPCG